MLELYKFPSAFLRFFIHLTAKHTSSEKMRVKSYTIAIMRDAWCFVARHFMRSFNVTTPFFIGGGWRIRAGEFGGKPYTSICEKFTAACWQEQVKMMTVTKSYSCSRLVKDVGTP